MSHSSIPIPAIADVGIRVCISWVVSESKCNGLLEGPSYLTFYEVSTTSAIFRSHYIRKRRRSHQLLGGFLYSNSTLFLLLGVRGGVSWSKTCPEQTSDNAQARPVQCLPTSRALLSSPKRHYLRQSFQTCLSVSITAVMKCRIHSLVQPPVAKDPRPF